MPVFTLFGPRELLAIAEPVSGEFGGEASLNLAAEVFLLSVPKLEIQL